MIQYTKQRYTTSWKHLVYRRLRNCARTDNKIENKTALTRTDTTKSLFCMRPVYHTTITLYYINYQ